MTFTAGGSAWVAHPNQGRHHWLCSAPTTWSWQKVFALRPFKQTQGVFTSISYELEKSTMRKVAIAFISALCIGVGGMASADENNKPSGEIDHMRMATAEVIAVDLPTRTVTLIGPAGNEFLVYLDDTVKNLPQTRVGDQVEVSYYESLVWNVKTAAGGNPGVSVQGEISSAAPGSKPSGTATAQLTMTVTIDSIDLDNGTVTLEGPRGNTHTLKASDPKNLERVQVGDLVDINYTETLSISVLSPPKK